MACHGKLVVARGSCTTCLPKGYSDCKAACLAIGLDKPCEESPGCCSCNAKGGSTSSKSRKIQQFQALLRSHGWGAIPRPTTLVYDEQVAVFNPASVLLPDNRTFLILARTEAGKTKNGVMYNVRNFQSDTGIVASLANVHRGKIKLIRDSRRVLVPPKNFDGSYEDPLLYRASNGKIYALISVYRHKKIKGKWHGNHQIFKLQIVVDLRYKLITALWTSAAPLCTNIVPVISEEKNWSPFLLDGEDFIVYQVNPLVIVSVNFATNKCQHRGTHVNAYLSQLVKRCKALSASNAVSDWNACMGRAVFTEDEPGGAAASSGRSSSNSSFSSGGGRSLPWPASLSLHLSGSTQGVQISPTEVLLVGHTKVKHNSLISVLKRCSEHYDDIGPLPEWHHNYEQEYFMFFYVVQKVIDPSGPGSQGGVGFEISKLSHLYLQPPDRMFHSTKIVFPRGLVLHGGAFYITYGEADMLSESMCIPQQSLLDMLVPVAGYAVWAAHTAAGARAVAAAAAHDVGTSTGTGMSVGTNIDVRWATRDGEAIALSRSLSSMTATLRIVIPDTRPRFAVPKADSTNDSENGAGMTAVARRQRLLARSVARMRENRQRRRRKLLAGRSCIQLGFVLYWNRDFDGKAHCREDARGQFYQSMQHFIREEQVENVQECCLQCKKDSKCEMFSYQWKVKTCYLKLPCPFFNPVNRGKRVQFVSSSFDPTNIAGHLVSHEYFVAASMSLPKGAASQIKWWDKPVKQTTNAVFGSRQGLKRMLVDSATSVDS